MELIVGVVTAPVELTKAMGKAAAGTAWAVMGSERRSVTTAPSTPMPSTVGGVVSPLTAAVAAEVTASAVP